MEGYSGQTVAYTPPVNVSYAGFWVRVVSSFIDFFLLSLPVMLVMSLLLGADWVVQDEHTFSDFVYQVIVAVITVYLWVNWSGYTPGKKIMGIKVVTVDNYAEVGYGKAILRYFGYFVSVITLGLGFIIVAFRQDKRGLHDLIAGTYVIYDKVKS